VTFGCRCLGTHRLGPGRFGVVLRYWHLIEINLHIVGVKIVIVSKLAN